MFRVGLIGNRAHQMLFGPIFEGRSDCRIVAAAEARGIPTRRLNAGSLVQLGQGARQRRIWTAETDGTSAIAESIAQDKELTKMLLRTVGVPVPEGRPVSSAEEAWEAAQEIGVPVVPVFVVSENPAATILDISATIGADVLMLGSSHRTKLVNLLKGNVITEVAKNLPENIQLVIHS